MIRYSSCRTVRNKSKDYKALANDFRDRVGGLADIQSEIKNGFSICPAQLGDRNRKKANVTGSQCVLIDIDEDLDISTALENPFVQSHCGLIYTTPSHTPERHRFRLIFPLPHFIEGANAVEAVIRAVMAEVPQADPACKDACRIFYGNTDAEFPLFSPEAALSEAFVEDAIAKAELEEKAKAEAKATRRGQRQHFSTDGVEDTKAEALDALGYIPPRRPGTNTYEESLTVLMALVSEFGESEAIRIGEQWSPTEGSWDVAKKVRSFDRDGVSIGSLFHIAKQYGWQRKQYEAQALQKRLAPIKKRQEIKVKSASVRPQTVLAFSPLVAEPWKQQGHTVVLQTRPWDLTEGQKPNRRLVKTFSEVIEPGQQWIIDPGLGEEHGEIESYYWDSIAAMVIADLMGEDGADVLLTHPQDRQEWLSVSEFKAFASEWYGGKAYEQFIAEHDSVVEVNTRYLSNEIEAIKNCVNEGKITLVSSQTNTGKTYAVQQISQQYKNKITFNPLVSLTEQTSKDFGIDAQRQRDEAGNFNSCAQPINSAWKFAEGGIPTDAPLLAYIDEITDCVDILASGSRLGKKQSECIQGLLNVLFAAVASGGSVITSQQTIPQRVTEWLKAVTGLDVQFVTNSFKQREGKVSIVEATSPLQAVYQDLLESPEPTVVASSSQKAAERLLHLLGEDKVVLVDAKTKERHKELFGCDNTAYLKRIVKSGKHLIYTPVLGTGTSFRFADAGFSKMLSLVTCGTLESNIQLNRRDRSGLPLTIYTMKSVLHGELPEYSWQSIVKQSNKRWVKTLEAVAIEEHLDKRGEDTEANALLEKLGQAQERESLAQINLVYNAKKQAQENFEKRHIAALLNKAYADMSESLEFSAIQNPQSDEFKEAVKLADDAIDDQETKRYIRANYQRFSRSDQAEVVASSGNSKYQERLEAQIYLKSQKFVDLNFKDYDVVRKAFVQDRGRYSKQTEILHDVLNLDGTLQRERAMLTSEAKRDILNVSCKSHNYQRARLINQSGLLELVAADKWKAGDALVQQVVNHVLGNAVDFELYLKVAVSDVQKTPLRLIHELLGRLGFEVGCIARQGAGERLKEYSVSNKTCAVREELLKALDKGRPRDLIQDSRVFSFQGRPRDLFDSGVKKVKLLANRITQVLVKCLETGEEFWASREKLTLAI